MRKPRDFDAELQALTEKTKSLKERKVRQLGELVAATGLDTLANDDRAVLYGAFLAVADRLRAEREQALLLWGRRGHRAFDNEAVSQRRGSADRSAPD